MSRFSYHVIKNFPPGYPRRKKLFANLLYLVAGTIIHKRKNLLTAADLRCRLRVGDVLLLGDFKKASSLLIRGPVTHSTLYVGGRKCIHAVADGVGYVSLHHLYTQYDTLVVLRPYLSRAQCRAVVGFAVSQIGRPYDFEFKANDQAYFCTELVNASFGSIGYHTGVPTLGHFTSRLAKIQKRFTTAPKALLPEHLVHGNFKVVFLSHNLKLQGKKLTFIGP